MTGIVSCEIEGVPIVRILFIHLFKFKVQFESFIIPVWLRLKLNRHKSNIPRPKLIVERV